MGESRSSMSKKPGSAFAKGTIEKPPLSSAKIGEGPRRGGGREFGRARGVDLRRGGANVGQPSDHQREGKREGGKSKVWQRGGRLFRVVSIWRSIASRGSR